MVYLFLTDGFEETEAVTVIDILRRGGVDIKTVAIGTDLPVGAHGIKVVPDIAESMIADDIPEAVILPGGGVVDGYLASETLEKLLSRLSDEDSYICAICAAPVALDSFGLISGRTVTCYPSCAPEISSAKVVSDKAYRDGRLITGKAPGAAADFGFKILETLKGKKTADSVRAGMYF